VTKNNTMQIKKKVKTEARIRKFEEQIVIEIKLSDEVVSDLSMMLMLLREDLVNSLDIQFSNLNARFTNRKGNFSVVRTIELEEKRVECEISRNGIDYILFFLLKYYRDGLGEAQHIDLDFKMNNSSICTFTFICDKFIEITGEELRKLLR